MYDGTVSYTRLSILPAMMIQSFSVKPSTSRSARSNLSTKQTTARPPLTLAPLSKSPLSRLFESYRTVSADAPLIKRRLSTAPRLLLVSQIKGENVSHTSRTYTNALDRSIEYLRGNTHPQTMSASKRRSSHYC